MDKNNKHQKRGIKKETKKGILIAKVFISKYSLNIVSGIISFLIMELFVEYLIIDTVIEFIFYVLFFIVVNNSILILLNKNEDYIIGLYTGFSLGIFVYLFNDGLTVSNLIFWLFATVIMAFSSSLTYERLVKEKNNR